MLWADDPLWYMGGWGQNLWGPLWDTYINSAGKQGEKPPADVQKFYDLVTKSSTDKPEDAMVAVDAVKAELKLHNWCYYYLTADSPIIINAKIGNIPEKAIAIAVDFSAEQFFFKK